LLTVIKEIRENIADLNGDYEYYTKKEGFCGRNRHRAWVQTRPSALINMALGFFLKN